MFTQTCYLLSYVKYGDNGAVLHCFSADTGYQIFFARGIYSSKNKKKPYLLPLNLLNITVSKPNAQKGISTASKIELSAGIHDFNDVKINSVLFFTADFLHQILREEHQNDLAFNEIEEFRQEIALNNHNSHISLIFNFLKISGIAPLFKDEKYLDPESGIFRDQISHPLFTEEISQLWKRFLTAPQTYSIKLQRAERNAFLDSLMVYYHLHFSGFYTPNSLAVLRQIYE